MDSQIGDALTRVADATLEAYGKIVASLGSIWVKIGTPDLITGNGSSQNVPGPAENADQLATVLGYATWVALAICIGSLMVAGARLAVSRNSDSSVQVDRIGAILLATAVISSAVSLVSALVPKATSNGSSAVAYIQDSLWFYLIIFATAGVIFGAITMAWTQRVSAGRDLVRSLITLFLVNAMGITVVSMLIVASDSFSVWILDGSLECSVTDPDGTCFGKNIMALMALNTNPATGSMGAILTLILGILAIFASIFQIGFMVLRVGALVLLTGVLPISAAATNTIMGKNVFQKFSGWLIAFILYKPAAAIVYATAFKLTGTNIFQDDGSGIISVIVGLLLMVAALIALPALMQLVAPAVGTITNGSGVMLAAAGGAAALPTGAVVASRMSSSRGGRTSQGHAMGSAIGGKSTSSNLANSGGAKNPTRGSLTNRMPSAGPAGTAAAGKAAGVGLNTATSAKAAAAGGLVGGPVGSAVGMGIQAGTGLAKAASNTLAQSVQNVSGGKPNGSQ